jgi:oligoendopeptidase F
MNTSWNLKLLYEGDNDPKIDSDLLSLEDAYQTFVNKWKNNTEYLTNPNILVTALDEFESLERMFGEFGNAGYYLSLRNQQDQNNSEIKAKLNKYTERLVGVVNQVQFFPISISKIDASLQAKFLDFYPLSKYRHFLFRLFSLGVHTLSDAEEKILNLKDKTSNSNWASMVSSILAKEKYNGKLLDELLGDLHGSNLSLVDESSKGINTILNKFKDVAENEINSILEDKKINDDLKKFPRPESQRYLQEDLDSEIVDTLVSTVSSRFDLSARFYRLRAQMTGVPRLGYHQRLVSLGESKDDFTWDQTVNIVDKVFDSLDPELKAIFKKLVDNGQVDVIPQIGKASGAFCASGGLLTPTYVLVNFKNKLDDVKTLAHEMGHAVHYELSKENHALDYKITNSLAETASTFMEDFVLDYLYKNLDPKQKIYLNIKRLDDMVGTIFRQVACYQFEQELHNTFRKVGYLGSLEIGRIFSKHMSAYMGDAVDITGDSENWWMYWHHIRDPFKVFAYTFGLLISMNLQEKVRKDPKNIEIFKKFLKAGASMTPRELFTSLNFDITTAEFWSQGLNEFDKLLSETENLSKEVSLLV